jgi:hypothetical protein
VVVAVRVVLASATPETTMEQVVVQVFVPALLAQEFFMLVAGAALVMEVLAPTLKDLGRLAVVVALTTMEVLVFLLLLVKQTQAVAVAEVGVQPQVQQAVLAS